MTTIVLLGLVAVSALLPACGNKESAEKAPQQQQPGAETPGGAAPAATQYTCSMHPEVKATAPGKCPQCGMDLVPVETSTESDSSQGGAPHS
jgi:hypothetical protein